MISARHLKLFKKEVILMTEKERKDIRMAALYELRLMLTNGKKKNTQLRNW